MRGEAFVDLLVEVADLANLRIDRACIERDHGLCGYILRSLARSSGVPGAYAAAEPCGVVGVVIMCAEVLDERAPLPLRALAARLSLEGHCETWRQHYRAVRERL